MKRFLLIIALFTLTYAQLQAQKLIDSLQQTQKPELHDFYLRQAKKHKTTGTILAASGLVLVSIGGLIIISQLENMFSETNGGYSNTGDVIAIAGTVITVSSIPFFIASWRAKRKANLILSHQTTAILPNLHYKQTAIGLAIPLGR